MSKSVEEVPKWATLIRELRWRANLTQNALADAVGAKQSSVAKWERGEYMPSPSALLALSKVFAKEPETFRLMELAGIPKGYLAGTTDRALLPAVLMEPESAKAPRALTVDVPLLTDAAASRAGRAVEEKDIEKIIQLPAGWFPRGASLYAFHVKGDSMSPHIVEGYVVIVDVKQRDPAKLLNQMVVACEEGVGVTVKWLQEDDGDLMLCPNIQSARHPPRRLKRGSTLRVVGQVLKWIGVPSAPPKRRT